MNKSELVSAIASESGLSKTDSKKALQATTVAIKNVLAKGESLQLIGFSFFITYEFGVLKSNKKDERIE